MDTQSLSGLVEDDEKRPAKSSYRRWLSVTAYSVRDDFNNAVQQAVAIFKSLEETALKA